jgi:hypothetical protein
MAKMTAKGVWLGGAGGGGVIITSADVAGALGMGLAPGPYHIGLAKYCLVEAAERCAEAEMCSYLARLAMKNSWTGQHRPARILGIANRAVNEVVHPPKCRTCRGRGEVWKRDNKLPAVCEKCNGEGLRTPSDRERALAIGLQGPSNWKLWEPRFMAAYHKARDWDKAVLNHLREQFCVEEVK